MSTISAGMKDINVNFISTQWCGNHHVAMESKCIFEAN